MFHIYYLHKNTAGINTQIFLHKFMNNIEMITMKMTKIVYL